MSTTKLRWIPIHQDVESANPSKKQAERLVAMHTLNLSLTSILPSQYACNLGMHSSIEGFTLCLNPNDIVTSLSFVVPMSIRLGF